MNNTLYKTLRECSRTSSSIEKKKLLQQAYEYNPKEFREFFELLNNNTRYNFSVKTMEKSLNRDSKLFDTPIDMVESVYSEDETIRTISLIDIRDSLEDFRKKSGLTQIQYYKYLSKNTIKPYFVLLTMLLLKNTHSGVSIKTANSVLESNGETPVEVFSPQLATTYESFDDVPYKEYLVCEKFDGFRCITEKKGDTITMTSRQGKVVNFLPEIEKELSRYDFDFIIDGEVVADSFNDIQHRIGKKDDFKKIPGLRYMLFDITNYQGESVRTMKQMNRLALLSNSFITNELIRVERAMLINDSHGPAQALYDEIVKNGGEGVIVKDVNSTYDFGSRKNWGKIKPVYNATMRVIGMEQGDNKYRNTLGALVVTSEDNKIVCRVGSGLTDEMREVFWGQRDKIGNIFIDVFYNEVSRDSKGNYSLRHPRFDKIRFDKEKADVFDNFGGKRF